MKTLIYCLALLSPCLPCAPAHAEIIQFEIEFEANENSDPQQSDGIWMIGGLLDGLELGPQGQWKNTRAVIGRDTQGEWMSPYPSSMIANFGPDFQSNPSGLLEWNIGRMGWAVISNGNVAFTDRNSNRTWSGPVVSVRYQVPEGGVGAASMAFVLSLLAYLKTRPALAFRPGLRVDASTPRRG